MAVKIVYGVAGSQQSQSGAVGPSAAVNSQTNQTSSSVLQQASITVAKSAVTSDAVVSALKSQKLAGSGLERPKDYKEAKEVASSVADRIKIDREGAGEAHSELEGVSAREHFK